VLPRFAYLAATNVFALLRLLPMSDRDKDVEILALRHQITVLERQLGKARPRFSPVDRAFLAALLRRLPRDMLGRFRLLVRPETVLRWHRDLMARRHAARSRPRRPGRPRTVRSIRLLVLRLARENPGWGYRRIHGELLVLGIKVAASTVCEILHQAGIDPAPERATATWGSFLLHRLTPLSGRTAERRFTSSRDEFVRHAQPHRSGRSAGEEAGDERPGEFVCRRASATGSMGP
jgi:putative transposase